MNLQKHSPKKMNKVAIASTGMKNFSRENEKIDDILFDASRQIFSETKNLTQKDVDAVLVSTNSNSKYLAAILSERLGIKPRISHTVESLCNSGTNTIVSGYSYVASGLVDAVLIAGGDRFDSPGQVLEWDSARGEFKHPMFWASIFTKSYKREYSINEKDIAMVSVKNHKNAQQNPHAVSTKAYSIEEVMNSKKLTDDLRLLECSRPCTGGSAVLLVSEKAAKKYTEQPIWIKGIGQKTLSASFTKNPELSFMTSTDEASRIAYSMAKIMPHDIDVAEIHDAFAVCEPMAIEALGFTEKGNGVKMVNDLYSKDDKKINPRGGLIGSGHPLGATGIAQTVEITKQLQNQAGKRQVDNSNIGLIHNMSAGATSSTVLVLEN